MSHSCDRDWNFHQRIFRLPAEKRKILAGRVIYCGCGFNYPQEGEFVQVYARGKDDNYLAFIACYVSFNVPLKDIHATRAERLDLLRNLVWSTPAGLELKGVCAWVIPAVYKNGTLSKEGYIDE